MELMNQVPFAKAQASTAPSPKAAKAKNEENAAAEVISFPTLLQENKNELVSGSAKSPQAEVSTDETAPQLADQSAADFLANCGIFDGISPLLSGPQEELPATPIESVGDLKAAVVEVSPALELVTGELTQSDAATVSETLVAQKTEVPEVATPVPAESLNQAPAQVDQLLPETQAPVATSLPKTPSDQVKISTDGGLVDVEKNVEKTTKDMNGAPVPMPSKVDESQPLKAIENETKKQEAPQVLPELETMKVEVVKDAAGPEQNASPVVENPALARQSSAELDLLTAQANAQKNYEQPAVVVDPAGTPKPTLADLDLDSGSFESSEQKDKNITRILSSLNESTSPLKRSIRSQVLNRVVEHLQEEIGKEKLTIRLNPEKLGQVEILFQAQGDQLNITVNSSGNEAEQAILEGTKELAENIADRSQRWNLVEIRVENRSQDQQSKQDSRQDERRDRQQKGEHQQQEGHPSQGDHNQETGASEWAAFHLGG